jgi:hypothetical protein
MIFVTPYVRMGSQKSFKKINFLKQIFLIVAKIEEIFEFF